MHPSVRRISIRHDGCRVLRIYIGIYRLGQDIAAHIIRIDGITPVPVCEREQIAGVVIRVFLLLRQSVLNACLSAAVVILILHERIIGGGHLNVIMRIHTAVHFGHKPV